MSSENQTQKCRLTATLYRRIKGDGSWKNISPAFFPVSVCTPWDDSLQHGDKSGERKSERDPGQGAHAALKTRSWKTVVADLSWFWGWSQSSSRVLALEPTYPNSTSRSQQGQQGVGQAVTKITRHSGMENIPSWGGIPGKTPAWTQTTAALTNSHG